MNHGVFQRGRCDAPVESGVLSSSKAYTLLPVVCFSCFPLLEPTANSKKQHIELCLALYIYETCPLKYTCPTYKTTIFEFEVATGPKVFFNLRCLPLFAWCVIFPSGRFLIGPRRQCSKMFHKKRRIACAIYLVLLVAVLVLAFIVRTRTVYHVSIQRRFHYI